jgi:hypothetical protein
MIYTLFGTKQGTVLELLIAADDYPYAVVLIAGTQHFIDPARCRLLP